MIFKMPSIMSLIVQKPLRIITILPTRAHFKQTTCALQIATLLTLNSLPSLAAQEDDDDVDMELVHVIGSRNIGRSSAELPVAVDTIDAQSLRNSGQFEVGRMLQNTAPSFNFSSSAISDGTDAIRPATLRGLGPDQTLVLVNNKRRHTAALIHINTSVGRGTSGTDLNAIPANAIKRIEILRDGAAAQYGSDAIAGVINIVLKDDEESTTLNGSYGVHSEGDGNTALFGLNHTFLLESGSLNATLEYRDRGATNRAGLTGVCQYLQSCNEINGEQVTSDDREIDFDRQNFRIGDAAIQQLSGALNGYWETFEGEYYGFLTFSARESVAAGFYRRANQSDRNPTLPDNEAFYQNGFLPEINSDLLDWSANIGYSTLTEQDINIDLSMTYGYNEMAFDVENSINASFAQNLVNSGSTASDIRNQTPTSAFAGKLATSLLTLNLDFVKENIGKNLAWGAEMRMDRYTIQAGEQYSWFDYDGIGSGAAAGIQVFPGFTEINQVSEDRLVYSGYLDAEWEFEELGLVNTALRFDHYEGFGDSINIKVAGRYDLSNTTSIRGSMNTGFRAPSMQQLYFNNISTQFNEGVAAQVGTFRNDSVLAQEIGIPELNEEQSLSVSGGMIYSVDNITATLDVYYIEIDDRIVISEQLTSGLGSIALDSALAGNGVQSAQFFINGAETQTQGVDMVVTWTPEVPTGILDMTFALNFTDTKVTDVFASGGLQGIGSTDLFGLQARSIIETWQPEARGIITSSYYLDKWSFFFTLNHYGDYHIIDGGQRQTFGAEWLSDIKVSYTINEHVKLNAGANNLGDNYPDRNHIGQSSAGRIVSADGSTVVDSPGVFNWSRRAAPFGFNGRFFYVGIETQF